MERYNEEYLATLDWDLRGVAELPWPVPMKFKKEEEPDFPADSLPEPVYKYVTALAESTQTDIRMAGLLSLGVLATGLCIRSVSAAAVGIWLGVLANFPDMR